tara:strand:+ start:505 stop:663 length:159 start_codon:yes stop_codon:yes gene_type:complete
LESKGEDDLRVFLFLLLLLLFWLFFPVGDLGRFLFKEKEVAAEDETPVAGPK